MIEEPWTAVDLKDFQCKLYDGDKEVDSFDAEDIFLRFIAGESSSGENIKRGDVLLEQKASDIYYYRRK